MVKRGKNRKQVGRRGRKRWRARYITREEGHSASCSNLSLRFQLRQLAIKPPPTLTKRNPRNVFFHHLLWSIPSKYNRRLSFSHSWFDGQKECSIKEMLSFIIISRGLSIMIVICERQNPYITGKTHLITKPIKYYQRY